MRIRDVLHAASVRAEESGGAEKLPPAEVSFNKETGEKTVVEYKLNDDGKRVRVPPSLHSCPPLATPFSPHSRIHQCIYSAP